MKRLLVVKCGSTLPALREARGDYEDWILAGMGVAPEHAVFLDDIGRNLKPARALGMTTIKVDEPARALAELERTLGFALGAGGPA